MNCYLHKNSKIQNIDSFFDQWSKYDLIPGEGSIVVWARTSSGQPRRLF